MESKQKLGRLITVVATFLAFSGIGVVDHAHQLKNFHYPQVQKNVILS
ncbi:hypothetical protein ACT7DB_01275 [Bacillus cereus]